MYMNFCHESFTAISNVKDISRVSYCAIHHENFRAIAIKRSLMSKAFHGRIVGYENKIEISLLNGPGWHFTAFSYNGRAYERNVWNSWRYDFSYAHQSHMHGHIQKPHAWHAWKRNKKEGAHETNESNWAAMKIDVPSFMLNEVSLTCACTHQQCGESERKIEKEQWAKRRENSQLKHSFLISS